MPIIKHSSAPRFDVHGVSVTGLAAPSRGARETCVWRVVLQPDTRGTLHTVDREEIFVVLSGRARATLGGETHELAPGDALIVPANELFSIEAVGERVEAIAALPVGGRAAFPAGEPFTPPWAA